MVYETDRLIMRHFLPDDVEKCMESCGKDTNLGRYIIGYPMKHSNIFCIYILQNMAYT